MGRGKVGTNTGSVVVSPARAKRKRKQTAKREAARKAKGAADAPKLTRQMTPEEALRYGAAPRLDDDLKAALRARTITMTEAVAEMTRRSSR